ncbi:hypothetical protein NL676_003918 [Syzygium grande]|nr:hypothetical protein NL676_003918 [Syzygium grande]
MTKDNRCSKYAERSYYTPRIYYPKPVCPLLTDGTHPGISSNKKQAVEAAINRPDFMPQSVYPLDKASNYPLILGQVRGELVSGPSQFLYTPDSSFGAISMNVGRKDLNNARQGDASAHSHHLRQILKGKVNNAHGFENDMSAPRSNFLRKAGEGRLLRTVGYNKCYGTFLSLGRAPQIKDGSNTPMDVIPNEGLDVHHTLGHNYRENIISGRDDEEPKHTSGMAIACNSAIVDYPIYAHSSGATSQRNIVELNAHQNNMPVYVIRNGGCNAQRTFNDNNKPKGNVVFGGVKVTAKYEAMVDNLNSAQSLGSTSRVGTVEPNAHPSSERNSNPAGNAQKHNDFEREKPKATGEPYPNVYLLSIPNLLSTGIFDGAPSKYVLKRRNYVSPYIFELHAGGRTKHPYTYIYLENGRTLYEVFQELRNTPEDMLFDAIPIVVGSAFNRPNFHRWKGHSNL